MTIGQPNKCVLHGAIGTGERSSAECLAVVIEVKAVNGRRYFFGQLVTLPLLGLSIGNPFLQLGLTRQASGYPLVSQLQRADDCLPIAI